jgi:hypothetical protein
MSLPKPILKDVDETSLTLSWDGYTVPDNCSIKIEYKLPHQSWEEAKSMNSGGSGTEVTVTENSEVADLEPGTPYFVRLVLIDANGTVKESGPETVFDTAPVNCTPKEKKCIIS